MLSRSRKIGMAVLLLALIAAAMGYYLWNKPHEDVAGTKGIPVEAAHLYNSFRDDTTQAKKNYWQQVLEVSGTVQDTAANLQGQTIIKINTGTSGACINCTMEGDARVVKQGMSIVVKGICQGMGETDADLGIAADVYLTRCYIVK